MPAKAGKGGKMLNHKTIRTIGMIILLAIGLSFAGGKSDKEVKKDTNLWKIDTIKLEKYERKVIIKAKVGKGPGEIGVIGEGPMPEEMALWEGSMEGPKGIAVDDLGNIFILDALNKRILKYSPDGRFLSTVNLVDFNNELLGNSENRLFIDSEGNFFIKERMIGFGEKIRYIYKYDKNGKLLAQRGDMPKAILNMDRKYVSSTVSRFTMIEAIKDTEVCYYINDSTKGRNYTIRMVLPRKEGWEYMITPYSFLGFDKEGNCYVKIDAFEQTPDLPPEELSEFTRKEEEVVFKYNENGKLVAMIIEACPGRGREMWTLGGDGAIYLMKYTFKTVVTDELPDWVKNDSTMPPEQKEGWRRTYTAPEGFVYIIKFTKMEEK